MVFENVYRLTAVVLTIGIALVPVWYPRYSPFRHNARKGIRRLQDIEKTNNVESRFREEILGDAPSGGYKSTQKIGSLQPDDPGFRAISSTIQKESYLLKLPTEIFLVKEEGGKGSLTIADDGIRSGNQAALFAEYENGEYDTVIRPRAFETKDVLKLLQLKRQVARQAEKRSHYWTTVLAVLWGMNNILLIF